MTACFLMRDQTGVDMDARGDREELGGVGIRETVIRIYYMKKRVFSVKEKNPNSPHMKTQHLWVRCDLQR